MSYKNFLLIKKNDLRNKMQLLTLVFSMFIGSHFISKCLSILLYLETQNKQQKHIRKMTKVKNKNKKSQTQIQNKEQKQIKIEIRKQKLKPTFHMK
jgi:uncharacterized membrane protein YciS (DUF1049 family)